MLKQKLRIGLLIDHYDIPLWSYKMIETIVNSNHSEIVLVVKNKTQMEQKTFFSVVWQLRKEILFIIYSKIEDKFFPANPNVFKTKNLKDIVNCKEISVQPKKIRLNDIILKNDIDEIKTHQIDVFIKLGFRVLRGDILTVSKYGAWSYHFGNYNIHKEGLAGVWEILNKCDDTFVTLKVLNNDLSKEILVYETAFNTDHLSINRNQNNIFWNSILILPRKLNELNDLGGKCFFQKSNRKQTLAFPSNNMLYETPSNFETFIGLTKVYSKALVKVLQRKFFFDQWILLFKIETTDRRSKSFQEFKRLLPPKDRFWADPFIFRKNNKSYIFIEELLYAENRGKISVIEMDDNANYLNPEVVLETDYHLSYPFLIEDGAELYMIPETQENSSIELYKCIEFPKKWKLEKFLFRNIKTVDTTIFKNNNKYWLFTNVTEYKGVPVINELFLFYSDSLFNDDWVSHPQNPITTNQSYSRPAGNIFIDNGRIYRPAQNCSKHYGYGIQIREIVSMTETEYEEKQVESIYPNWTNDLISTHTLNSVGKLTFIDALIKRKR